MHEERIVGTLYGPRALLMQACDPVAFTGLMSTTRGADKPFKRLSSTARHMETVFFGSCAQADRVTRSVRKMHERVHGTIDEQVGPYPAGTRFDATAPDTAFWILACLADSALAVYTAFIGSLTPAELDSFWQDYLTVGEMFGLSRSDMPHTYRQFRAYMTDRLDSAGLYVTAEASSLGKRVAFAPPVPLPGLPALLWADFSIIALLPQRVRDLYGLPWNLAFEAAFQLTSFKVRLAMRFVPGVLRHGSSALQYELVAQTEKARL
ncbi:MAG: oxygenase MpaB family protein, partial [bacterium]